MRSKNNLIKTVALFSIIGSVGTSSSEVVSADSTNKDTAYSGFQTSTDWNNSENWSSEQIAAFLNSPEEKSTDGQETSPVPSDIQQIDKYITIQSNQYVILSEAKQALGDNEYQQIVEQLQKANEEVRSSNAVIDLSTKSFDRTQIETRSANPSTQSFWWGTRYYLTSNAQVNTMVYLLNSYANRNYAIGGIPGAGALMSWNGARLSQAALDLGYYNQLHISSHIFMNENDWLGTYSFGTF